MKPRVLFAHQWKSAGGLYGSDKVLLDLLEHAAISMHPIVVIESEGRFADLARGIPCEVLIRDMGVLRRRQMTPPGLAACAFHALRSAFWLSRYIREHNVSLVVTNTVSVLAGAVAAKLSGRPHVWLVHEILEGRARLLAPIVRYLGDRIIGVSNASADSLGAPDKTEIAYPGVNAAEFENARAMTLREEYGIQDGTVLIGIIGRIHYWKGQDYFLEALGELNRRGVAEFHALVVGDVYAGYEELKRQLIARAQSLGLASRVTFCGHLDDIASVYKGLDIVVAPSTRPDPFCLVVAESMAAGRAVISTNWGGPSEIIEHGTNGILIAPDNAIQFADALEKLVQEPEVRRRLGEAGQGRVRERFSRHAFKCKVLETMEPLLRNQSEALFRQPASHG